VPLELAMNLGEIARASFDGGKIRLDMVPHEYFSFWLFSVKSDGREHSPDVRRSSSRPAPDTLSVYRTVRRGQGES
jgi:hypothetical protein